MLPRRRGDRGLSYLDPLLHLPLSLPGSQDEASRTAALSHRRLALIRVHPGPPRSGEEVAPKKPDQGRAPDMAFTFFFRDLTPLKHAVRFLLATSSGRSRVRIWDAGCAMGQEPYSLAILLAENMGRFAFRAIEIHATDHDEPLLKVLSRAVYPQEELKRIPERLFQKYFEPDTKEGHYRLVPTIRSAVHPRHHDLLSLTPFRTGFSLVICKNVLLHFQPEERVEVIRMFHQALDKGGIFVTEHTQKLPEEVSGLFQQLVGDGQVFRKVEVNP